MTKDEAMVALKALELQDKQFNNESYDLAIARQRGQDKMALLKKILEGYETIEKASKDYIDTKVKFGLDDAKRAKDAKQNDIIEYLTQEVVND